ncbi:protein translocase subunit SecF [Neoactinobaculum massilliense]|uniref:protein translocase subunit SecF n=1 Tax=Neoactinobaculum massilliense TaxID=2364794 RepID=UPI000F5374A5|nr:protein translocase subunit SecF [Neoactinobaculum massilliense]
MSMYSFGNALYSGKKSYRIVQNRKIWFTIAIVAVIVSLAALGFKGLNLGIDFTGGSQFTVSNASTVNQRPAVNIISQYAGEDSARVAQVGKSALRVQVAGGSKLSNDETTEIRSALADAYGTSVEEVTSTFIGPVWGQDISVKALQGFIWFIVLVFIGLSLYFRSWRSTLGAVLALFHDLIVTVGIYCLFGLEFTPSTVIGLLTILGYSLYDTVVVFDKVRENSEHLLTQKDVTFAESTNLAVNQTLIRSINTSVTSLLPVACILFIGVGLLGAGSLRDLATVLFMGLILSALSSIFLASPLAVTLTNQDPAMKKHTAEVEAARLERKRRVEAGEEPAEEENVLVGIRTPGEHLGASSQPHRKNRRKKK